MNTSDFIEVISKSGISLTVINGDLKIRGSRESLSPEVIDEIKLRKPEIIELLSPPVQKSDVITPVDAQASPQSHHQYELPSGEKITLSEDEFNELVEAFRLLHSWQYEKSA